MIRSRRPAGLIYKTSIQGLVILWATFSLFTPNRHGNLLWRYLKAAAFAKALAIRLKAMHWAFITVTVSAAVKSMALAMAVIFELMPKVLNGMAIKALLTVIKCPMPIVLEMIFAVTVVRPCRAILKRWAILCCQPEPWTMSRPCSRRLIFFMPRVLSGVVQKASQKQYLALILIQNNISKLFINNHL